jgi:hypothetical protein
LNKNCKNEEFVFCKFDFLSFHPDHAAFQIDDGAIPFNDIARFFLVSIGSRPSAIPDSYDTLFSSGTKPLRDVKVPVALIIEKQESFLMASQQQRQPVVLAAASCPNSVLLLVKSQRSDQSSNCNRQPTLRPALP